MLWSLIKILFFLMVVILITLGAVSLMESQAGVTIEYAGFELSFGALQATILGILFTLALWVFLKVFGLIVAVFRFLNGDETALSRYLFRNRERRGFEALSAGLMALASGDGAEAMTKAKKADKLLGKPELTNLVIAQAAVASGDKKTARATYKKLLQNPKTRFVGVHGLLQQTLQSGDMETALKLAERAFALKPKHVETQDVLLKLQAGQKDWMGIRDTLKAKLKHGALPKNVHKRRDAIFALSQAMELQGEGNFDESHKLALEANRLSPALVPAALLVARGQIKKDKPKLASRTILAAWELGPHPELATVYAAIDPHEAPLDRIKRFQKLTKSMPKHPETKMLLAELNIAASNYTKARSVLRGLAKSDPTMRSLTIMAAIERGEGADDQTVRQLLTQAISAQRDPQWICENCGETYQSWESVCLNCEAIDSVSWKRPPQSESVSAEMLPLIIGQMAKVDQGVTSVLSDNEIEAISETSVEDKQKKS